MSQTNGSEFSCPTGLRQINVCGTLGVEGTDSIDYSQEEQWTGQYWIDGKKIYQKTVNCGGLKNNAVSYIPHGIANMAWVVDSRGAARNANNSAFFTLPFSGLSPIGVSITPTNIQIVPTMDRREFTMTYVTIWYTCTDR